jgi:hypothetical protein
MGRLLRQRPSPAMIVALLALFVSLGGSSYAALKVGSKNIKRSAVTSRAIKNNTVTSADVRNGTLTGRDVKNNSLRNADIVNSNLRAATAKQADAATNADKLGGIASTGFTRPDCTSQTGSVKGFARIAGAAYNCSGGTVEARRLGVGTYEVRFNGGGQVLALVDILESGVPTITSVSAALVAAGTFRVQTVDTATGVAADNVAFVIATL